MENSPADSIMKIKDKNNEIHNDTWDLEEREVKKKTSGILTVMVAGLALFSDGYNAQISMLSVIPFGSQMLIPRSRLHGASFLHTVSFTRYPYDGGSGINTAVYSYKSGMSSTIKARLSNSYLIGEIFGMLFFGVLIDRMGRRTGIIAATLFLVLGVVLATAAHGTTQLGCDSPCPTLKNRAS